MPSLDPIPAHVVAHRQRIGRRIRIAREDANLTQEQLGERVDMHRNTIGNIENGVHSPRLDSLLMIANVVRVPLRDLIGE